MIYTIWINGYLWQWDDSKKILIEPETGNFTTLDHITKYERLQIKLQINLQKIPKHD
jgi:hypothetical protein